MGSPRHPKLLAASRQAMAVHQHKTGFLSNPMRPKAHIFLETFGIEATFRKLFLELCNLERFNIDFRIRHRESEG